MNISSKPLSRIAIFLPILVAVVILFNFTPAGDFTRNAFLSVSKPLQSAFWSKGVSIQKDNFEEKDPDTRLIAEIAELERQLEEMEELRQALDLEINKDFEVLDALVLGRATENDHLILSRGSNDQVREGMPVISSSRVLVGEVAKSLKDFSYVRLISHPDTNFDGRVLGKDDSLGVIKSEENLIMEMINREADLEEGDKVVTHPGGGIYPGGIFIGEVAEIVRDDAEAFQSVIVDPGFKTRNLEYLFIITDF